jgi:hypothetical protein
MVRKCGKKSSSDRIEENAFKFECKTKFGKPEK